VAETVAIPTRTVVEIVAAVAVMEETVAAPTGTGAENKDVEGMVHLLLETPVGRKAVEAAAARLRTEEAADNLVVTLVAFTVTSRKTRAHKHVSLVATTTKRQESTLTIMTRFPLKCRETMFPILSKPTPPKLSETISFETLSYAATHVLLQSKSTVFLSALRDAISWPARRRVLERRQVSSFPLSCP
jgi:hypothetical protein